MRLYEQAIRTARENGFVQNEGVANELAAQFYLKRGIEKMAHTCLRDARYCYQGWGALGKVQQLDERYPAIAQQASLRPTNTIDTSVEQLDLATVMKASQAVSGEIVLEKLIKTLMIIALQHAGAERGLLVLPNGAEQRIAAEARTGPDCVEVKLRDETVAPSDLPDSLLHYVIRTQESVILDDAWVQNLFPEDEFVRQQRPKSILCLPLVKQAKLMGVLYLENNLAPRVFTPKRLAMLKILASQAAISLENTRLYRDLEEREGKIRRLVDANIIGIFIGKVEGEISEANEAFLQMVNYSREDLVSGRVRWPDLTPAEWRDRDERTVGELNSTGILQPLEKEYFRKDGSRVPVLIGAAVFEGSKNEGVAFVLDLSEQKRAEEALRRSEAYLSRAQRLSRTGSFGWRLSSGKIYWSHETFRIFEYDLATEPTLELVLDRTHPEDRALVQQLLDRVSRDRKEFDLEHRLLMSNDSVKYVRVVGHPSTEDESGDLEFVGAVTDITDRKLAEEGLRTAQAELAQQEKARLEAQKIYLQEEILSQHNFAEIVGNSRSLLAVLQQVDQVASTEATVLIQGETGTGKELIARAIHDRSRRHADPLVKVNCGAISAGLVESELFGHVKGAFTGALADRNGRFALADGGTIFLDEVGELPPDTQVKLLRVLQEQEFVPIGSSKTIKVDVRVIAATNRNLFSMILEGKFRSDLFYRLNVFPVTVPPLRDRKEDIPLLTKLFIEKFARKLGRPIAQVAEESMFRLCAYSWPGNIRELQNVIERAVVLSKGPLLTVEESALFDFSRIGSTFSSETQIPAPPSSNAMPLNEVQSLEDVERQHIIAVLTQAGWRIEGKRGAAKLLNLQPSTLRSRMQKLGIVRNQV